MGKPPLAPIGLGVALFVGSVMSPVGAVGKRPLPWKSPWKEQAHVHLQTLVNEGYEMVGASFGIAGISGVAIEAVYLKKGKSVYRCVTTEKPGLTEHSCGMLVSPEKGQ
jgi:hypothetical protein